MISVSDDLSLPPMGGSDKVSHTETPSITDKEMHSPGKDSGPDVPVADKDLHSPGKDPSSDPTVKEMHSSGKGPHSDTPSVTGTDTSSPVNLLTSAAMHKGDQLSLALLAQ